jgi:hypothetical protein
MREYPSCGFKDPPYWRNVRYRLYTQYCRIDDLELNEPELYAKIRANGYEDFTLKNYIYHTVKGGVIVQKIHVDDSRDGKTIREPEQEKAFKFLPLNQSRLVCKSSEKNQKGN